MSKTVALLLEADSPLAGLLPSAFQSRGYATIALNLQAAFAGKPVTVASDGVLWEGRDLLAVAAVFVERPVYPWPQESLPPDAAGKAERDAVYAARQARSLTISALRCAAEIRPVVNPPALAAEIAASPAVGLVRLAREGLPVLPWSLRHERPAAGESLLIDPAGRDIPALPDAGGPVIVSAAASEAPWSVLVLGTTAAAGGSLQEQEPMEIPREIGPPEEIPGPIARLAVDATARLGLDLGAVIIGGRPDPAVVVVDAAPLLSQWLTRDETLAGMLAGTVVERLERESG